MNYLGDFVEDDVVYLMFNTFTSDDPSASCTITNFVNTDVHIHKDDSTTQRNNAAGITVSVNFDGITGSHLIKIDTNDNTVAGFWVTGHDYFVRIEGTTVDGATLNIVVGHFSIQNRYTRGTDSAALAATALTDVTWTDAKAGHLDAPISTVDTVVDGIQTDLSNVTDGLGALKALLDTISGYTDKIDDATNGLTAIKAEVEGLAGAAMRGTDSANTTVPDAAGVAPTAVEIQTQMEGAGSKILAIEGDTNELQTDWKDTGRLDNLLDACNTVVPDVAGTAPTAVEIRQEMDTNSTKMAPSQTLNDYKANVASLALEATLTAIKGGTFNGATDCLEALRDRGDAAWTTGAGGTTPTTLQNTTIATLASQTSFTLTAGSADDDAYKDMMIVIEDAVTATQKAVGIISAYAGGSKTVTLLSDPGVFTMAVGDTVDVIAVPDPGAVADAVWDEILTGATHNIATSAGRRLREVGAFAIHGGTAQDGDSHSITLAATASADDGVYNRNLIVITDNTGVGQTRTIVDYDGTTKVVVVDRDWRVSPDATSVYQITPDDTPLTVDHGKAQAGTASTITLRAYASGVDDAYLCNIIAIIAGTGRGQARLVGSYNGTSKVATVCGNDWVTTPDTTSIYVMIPYGTTCTSCIGTHALAQIKSEADDALSEVNLDTHDANMKALIFSEY